MQTWPQALTRGRQEKGFRFSVSSVGVEHLFASRTYEALSLSGVLDEIRIRIYKCCIHVKCMEVLIKFGKCYGSTHQHSRMRESVRSTKIPGSPNP